MSSVSSISEFLLQAGTQYRLYDMGRGIRKLNSQQFLELESGQHVYPYPRQQLAWLAVVFWNKNLSEQHYIWFIKLPLDEQGFIIAAHRDQFMAIIVEALGQELQHTESKQGQLPENPYTFVPPQQQLADFNAISRRDLKQKPSDFYLKAQQYLAAPQIMDWQQLALQGIADFVARLQQDNNQQLLISQWKNLPEAVRLPLLNSLENQVLSTQISEFLCEWLQQQDGKQQAQVLRSLSQSPAKGLVLELLQKLLAEDKQPELDLLIVIAGRHWHYLQQAELLNRFMQKLAELNQTQAVFASLYADLVQLPDLRPHILAFLRNPNKTPEQAKAVGELFTEAKS